MARVFPRFLACCAWPLPCFAVPEKLSTAVLFGIGGDKPDVDDPRSGLIPVLPACFRPAFATHPKPERAAEEKVLRRSAAVFVVVRPRTRRYPNAPCRLWSDLWLDPGMAAAVLFLG